MAKRSKAPPDLNREVANALGAATGTTLPQRKNLPESDESKQELAKKEKSGLRAKRQAPK